MQCKEINYAKEGQWFTGITIKTLKLQHIKHNKNFLTPQAFDTFSDKTFKVKVTGVC